MVKAVFKQLWDKILYIRTVNAFSSMLKQENTTEVVFNAKLLRLVGVLGIYMWLWEDLVLKNWLLCSSHTSFFPPLEIVRAMTHVINQGMAMYWGTSRWSAMEIMVKSIFGKALTLGNSASRLQSLLKATLNHKCVWAGNVCVLLHPASFHLN